MDGITTSINAILKNLIKNFNTLLDCPVRFSGDYDGKKVHNFIEYIEHYKRIKCIGDEQALQELQFLLLDQAHTWWLRRKANLNTWSEALTILENQYSKRRPAHVVYMEILKHHYEDYETKDDFIDDKIELFNELSQPELREENKLQIIYALLPNEIQNKVKIVDISNIEELKEQLKLIKLDSVQMAATTDDNVINDTSSTATETVTQNNNVNKDSVNQEPSNQSTIMCTEKNEDPERDPIIKVRRTEDLMPSDIKEEDAPTQQEEFINTDTETANNAIHINHEDFHIDSDIMNQINNIINESEMNMNAINNDVESPSVVKPVTNGIASLELLGFNIRTINQLQSEITHKTSSDNQCNKTSLNVTKKLKIRCSYCRKCNHTAQVCFKRAKHMKEFPEKFLGLKTKENDIINSKNNEEPIETMSLNNTNISSSNVSTAETIIKVPTILSTQSTSIPQTSLTTTSSVVTTSTAVILNNIPEKCINSSLLTTKLIAPINGKTTNKILTSKLRNINTPSPKCHQCGTVGFYKSICPNCSPIYNNNNNNHNPFGK
ncbi:probable myosin light chain kinase DDB_G0279831 isoform X1 [Lucilia cuprina]|uniref:probable myosin light chain kinase DDB_G0279831 isoform X1 n=1 Tax=Lucilia cuprina TaxID=7375 RepID=UPI001F0676D5|nr:probable myosin light chain kinase DDB_G0279831 isoform X1 [Lucilia cuprina]